MPKKTGSVVKDRALRTVAGRSREELIANPQSVTLL